MRGPKEEKMRTYLAMAVLLAFLTVCGAQAEEAKKVETKGPPMLATLHIIQVSDAQFKKLDGIQKTNSEIPGRVLQTLEVTTVRDMPSLVHMGEKWPIVYYDPRAQQFQVQYVDIGGKLDLTCRDGGNQTWDVEIRPEISSVYRIDVPADSQRLDFYPETMVLIAETTIKALKFGETSVFAKSTGRAAKTYLEAMGLPAENSSLIYTLKLEPQQ